MADGNSSPTVEGSLVVTAGNGVMRKNKQWDRSPKAAAQLAILEMGYIVYLNPLPTNYDTCEVLLTQQI